MILGFEGAEKILQIKIASVQPNSGLRGVPRMFWERVLDTAKCTILSECESDNCTCYVLSESSLFVFENTCIFKTCGRTLLLLTIPLILKLLKERGLQLEFLLFSSKNYLYPEDQYYPHNTWEDSELYLHSYFPEENCCILGDKEDDHVFLFSYSPLFSYSRSFHSREAVLVDDTDKWDNTENSDGSSLMFYSSPNDSSDEVTDDLTKSLMKESQCSLYRARGPSSPIAMDQSLSCEGGLDARFLNMMMYDMKESIAKQFFKSDQSITAKQVTRDSGIDSIYPGSLIDDFLFEPCGYSMNGLSMNGFYSIHITPETNCSYVSFETNIACSDYFSLLTHVLTIFKPKRFSVTFFYHCDMGYMADKSPLLHDRFVVCEGIEYYRTCVSNVTKNHCVYSLGNYSMV